MNQDPIPKHIAIIMDGNGRWAQKRHMPRAQGHVEGTKRVEEIIAAARKAGIESLTLYAFSTENWTRPEDEVSMLMGLFIKVLEQKIQDLHANGIQLKFIGRRDGVPGQVLQAIDRAMTLTQDNSLMTVNVAFNYGSRNEIVDAARSFAVEVAGGRCRAEDLDEEKFSQHLYTRGQPDVDLLIRTSGEQRISNFLLWQISYAELYFTPLFWPEFTPAQLALALREFAGRQRRYGGIRV